MFDFAKKILLNRSLAKKQVEDQRQTYDAAIAAIRQLSYEEAKRTFYSVANDESLIRLSVSPSVLKQAKWLHSVPESIRDVFVRAESVRVVTNTVDFVVDRNMFELSALIQVTFLGLDQDGFRIFATSTQEGVYVEDEGDDFIDAPPFDQPSLYPSAYHYFLIQTVEF